MIRTGRAALAQGERRFSEKSFPNAQALLPLSMHSGHGGTPCWFDPVANDPRATRTFCQRSMISDSATGCARLDPEKHPVIATDFRAAILNPITVGTA